MSRQSPSLPVCPLSHNREDRQGPAHSSARILRRFDVESLTPAQVWSCAIGYVGTFWLLVALGVWWAL